MLTYLHMVVYTWWCWHIYKGERSWSWNRSTRQRNGGEKRSPWVTERWTWRTGAASGHHSRSLTQWHRCGINTWEAVKDRTQVVCLIASKLKHPIMIWALWELSRNNWTWVSVRPVIFSVRTCLRWPNVRRSLCYVWSRLPLARGL
jgi:hypothetical protein